MKIMGVGPQGPIVAFAGTSPAIQTTAFLTNYINSTVPDTPRATSPEIRPFFIGTNFDRLPSFTGPILLRNKKPLSL